MNEPLNSPRVTSFGDDLKVAFGAARVRAHVDMAAMTTFKVGGPADWLIEVRGLDEIRLALNLARRSNVPVTVLGGGSNVLVGDRGIRGLVLRVRGGEVRQVQDDLVRADAGVTLNGLVRWTVSRGLSGLEMWAGTPGTVGGAVCGNAHFRGRLIGGVIEAVGLISNQSELVEVPGEAMEFAYDDSRVRRTGEVVAWADFRVGRADPARLRKIARQSLQFRKQTQPLSRPSSGCIFQNPDPAREQLPDGVPASAGALIDRAGLKGARQGGAVVSPTHANFIVNDGEATAADIRSLIRHCRTVVEQRFGITLCEEVVYVGDFGE